MEASVKSINIPVRDMKHLYRLYITMINPMFNLRNKEIEVLSLLYYHNNIIAQKFKDPEDEAKWVQLFSTTTRKEIAKELNITLAVLANNISSLRKKGFIKDNQLDTSKLFYIEQDFSKMQLTYNFINKNKNE